MSDSVPIPLQPDIDTDSLQWVVPKILDFLKVSNQFDFPKKGSELLLEAELSDADLVLLLYQWTEDQSSRPPQEEFVQFIQDPTAIQRPHITRPLSSVLKSIKEPMHMSVLLDACRREFSQSETFSGEVLQILATLGLTEQDLSRLAIA